MAIDTKIQWTESTWDPTTGCSKVSEGCKNCWAKKIIETRLKHLPRYKDGFAPTYHGDRINDPYSWRKPRMVFVCSQGDLFHDGISFTDKSNVFNTMVEADSHTYQVLTKRPDNNMKCFLEQYISYNTSKQVKDLNHIWLGITAENQKRADERIPILLSIPAKVRWVSLEPLLEPISFRWARWLDMKRRKETDHLDGLRELNWVVIGCESGKNRRPCNIEWVRSIVKQCQEAQVPVFVKQLNINGKVIHDINKFPEDLRVRQWPIPPAKNIVFNSEDRH